MGYLEETFSLKGKVAIITGGTKGLGYEIARSFACAGAMVLISGRKEQETVRIAESLASSTKGSVLGTGCDVRNAAQVASLTSYAVEMFGGIDILVTSAGINIRHPIEDFPEESFKEVLDINLTGTWLSCRAVVPYMKKKRYGRIITLGSIFSLVSIPDRTAYSASKGGVIQITKTLALELAAFGITANCICPGPFETEINAVIFNDPSIRETFLSNIPVGRFGDVKEVGALAVSLASDAFPFMTGSIIPIDGGWTAR